MAFGTDMNISVFWSLEAATKYNKKPLKKKGGGEDSEELKDSEGNYIIYK